MNKTSNLSRCNSCEWATPTPDTTEIYCISMGLYLKENTPIPLDTTNCGVFLDSNRSGQE